MFTDPNPSLIGPPTQTISGVKNKPPVVDNPNIKLPSQEVKSLISTPQPTKNGVQTEPVNKNGLTNIKPDGLNKNWSPNKYSPESISGNDNFINPKTGTISKITKKIDTKVNSPRIKTVEIPRYDSTEKAQSLLNLPKSPLGK